LSTAHNRLDPTQYNNNNNNKIDYIVRNDKVTAQALQEIQEKNN